LTGTSAVVFGSAAASSFTVVSDTSITATSPAGSAGTFDVTVTTVGGTSATSSADDYTYVSAPTVTSVAPAAGPLAGGTSVTITGTHLAGATAVAFGSTAATSYTVVSATKVTAVTPAGTTGTVDVTVTTAGGASATSSADAFRYAPIPTVTSISPSVGPMVGGTKVVVTGTGFTGATLVSFSTAGHATSFTVNSDTQITAVNPAYAAGGPVHVRVTTPGGTDVPTPVDLFTYGALPAVTAITPTAGPTGGGTVVTVTGTAFSGATSVTFGASNATTFTVNSATSITATAPAGTGNANIRVSTPIGTSSTVPADLFTYVVPPVVTSVAPSSGPTTGATSVTITGTGLTAATAVSFGSSPAASFTVNSDTSITATSPAHAAGIVDVTVTTAGGTSATSGADAFTFVAPPAVSGIAPNLGPTTGATTVTVTGTGFTGATKVLFGSTSASYTVNSDTSITATSPAGTGSVHVRVMTPYGTSTATAADLFGYGAAPVVTAITPTVGPLGGGTVVTVTGTALTGATKVTFGATNATTYTVNSDTSITATSPAGTAGNVHVRVMTPFGSSATSPADLFTYAAVPTVTSVAPNTGPTAGGTSVTITGTGLTGATAVKFGSGSATGVTVVSDTQITATAPAGAVGTVDVTVITAGGTSATGGADSFGYVAAPVVSTIAPSSGPLAGGTVVTVTGTGFTGATKVAFGANAATTFMVNSDTSITATSPSGTGSIHVRVTTAYGLSAATTADLFGYGVTPVVTGISPASGPDAGGTVVTITGTGFLGTTKVSFGANAATTFTVNSDTSITATSPPGSTGNAHIRITNPAGVSAAVTADLFHYSG
jgi:hypothetical protein